MEFTSCGSTRRGPSSDAKNPPAQSLAFPHATEGRDRKRKLLVIYIHGFIGNDGSFRSFPSHVHSCLKARLAATHEIYTKIYPRYKTYNAFHLARDKFSEWLLAHETLDTDIILVGHSMGGLLAAEVVLMVKHHNEPHSLTGSNRSCRLKKDLTNISSVNTESSAQLTWTSRFSEHRRVSYWQAF